MLLHHRRVIDHNDYRHANWFQASEFEAKAKLMWFVKKICAWSQSLWEAPVGGARGGEGSANTNPSPVAKADKGQNRGDPAL